jgi:branched-chain amino acid transport system substrate-binding protein
MENHSFQARQFVLIAAILSSSFLVLAQEKSATRSTVEVEAQFKQGVDFFNAGRYEEALRIFDGLSEGEAKHRRMAAALYMRARAAHRLGRYEAARTALDELERSFPKSNYVQHGQALQGMMAFQKEEYLESAVEFLLVVEAGRNAALRNQATEWLRAVLEDYLSLNDLRRLRRNYNGPRGTPYLVLALARDEMASGHRENGEKLIDDFLRTNPDTPLRAELLQLRQTGGEPVATVLRVGLVLPITGIDADAGMGVYRGIKYAQLTGGTNNGSPAIEFVVRDSESSIMHALKVTQNLLDDPAIVAIIGEVDNATTGAMAALANAKGIPFLAPVATENGIGALGENVFQLNADRERKSRALAEYAYKFLNARTFATLAPQDDYGQQMTDGFSAAVDSLGGEIFTQKWYYGEPQDLGRSFKAIRAAAFRRAYKDSLRLKLSVASSPKINDAEEVDIPVTNLHAIFMPLHEEDIKLVAGQRAYFNLQSVILGGEQWYLADLAKNKELQHYVEGTIFASDYFIDPENVRYKQFRNDFRTRMGATPEKWELCGYDTANLLFKAIAEGGRSRSQIREALAKTDNFIGMKGEIALNNPEKVNSRVSILQIRGAQIVKLR